MAGTPTVAGTFSFTVQVTDAHGQSATEPVSLVITPAMALTVSASANFGTPVTLTATMTPAAATGSVTFTDLLSSGPQDGQPAMTGTPTNQYAWVRLAEAGARVNTGNNAADFQLVSTTGGVVGGVQSALGSPSPLASGSPVPSNGALPSALLDPAQASSAGPNYVLVSTVSGDTLTIRRTITNTSGQTITSAELRITSLSEANGAPEPDVTTQPSNPAALQIIDPAAPTSQVTITGGVVLTVQNLSVNPRPAPFPGAAWPRRCQSRSEPGAWPRAPRSASP